MNAFEKWEDKWQDLQCDVSNSEQELKSARDEVKMLQQELRTAIINLEQVVRSHTNFKMLLKFHDEWLRPKEEHESRTKRGAGRAKRVARR